MEPELQEYLLQEYDSVSQSELEKIWETCQYPVYSESVFVATVRYVHHNRGNYRINGRESIVAGPLVEVLSVQLLRDTGHPANIFGSIHCEFPGNRITLYDRKETDPEILGSSGSLTLCCSDRFSNLCTPSHDTSLIFDLSDGNENWCGKISCVEDTSKLEETKLECIRSKLGVLGIRYMSMQFGVHGRVRVLFFHESDELDNMSVQLYGKVVARYSNTYNACDLERCTLFEKTSAEFERVKFNGQGSLKLCRPWLALPVYSTLILEIDLFEFESGRQFLKETVHLRVNDDRVVTPMFVVNDVLVLVDFSCFSPYPQGASSEVDDEESSDGETDDEEMSDPLMPSPKLRHRWQLLAHRSKPISSPSVEIFSVYIWRKESMPLQVFGTVEICSDEKTAYIFKTEAGDALCLSGCNKQLPVIDGARGYNEYVSLRFKVDIKDVDGRFHARGYVDWHHRTFEFGKMWLNKQLCSVVDGDGGFAVISYSIFEEAVQAKLGFFCSPKNSHVDRSPELYGRIVACYGNYDYESCYNKDCYRVILFQKNQDAAQAVAGSGEIPLSRTSIVVPLNSMLVIEADLRFGDGHALIGSREFQIGSDYTTLENENYSVNIHVKWVQVD